MKPRPKLRWPWLLAGAALVVGAAAAHGTSHRSRPSAAELGANTVPASATPVSATPSSRSAPTSATASPSTTAKKAASPRRHPPTTQAATAVRRHGAAGANRSRGARIFHGVLLPDPKRTPGATSPAVTPATIYSTICVSGWTAQVRPPSSYTTALKEEQLATGYAWHGDTDTGDYEEDHLIPLELGGSPSSPANLWPEPYDYNDGGATSKDTVENRLHDLVCSGNLGLRAAQHAIASNWLAAAQRYGNQPVSRTRSATPRPAATRSRSAPPPADPGCTTTSSGSCIRGGEFCPKGSYGETGYDATGATLECTGNASHPHWE